MNRIISILTMMFWVLMMGAQNISVADFKLDEMDLTANQQGTIVLDQNGEKCALIKVITTQTGFNFDAGSLGVCKTLQKTAQIWVYVPHGVRKLNISHQKYGQLDYQLPVTTQKAKTYIMNLKAETPLPVNSQRLTIKCQPKNAVVMIDGEMVNITNGMAEITLKLGTHKYQAMANDYYQSEGTIELRAERPSRLAIELEAKESSQLKEEETNTKERVQNITDKPEQINYDGPHEYIDLGLPSGTLWATCNLGATKPEEIGAYYAWGDTEGHMLNAVYNEEEHKRFFGWEHYKYCDGTYKYMTKYCTNSKFGLVDNKTTLDPTDDAATVNWGEAWRIPTIEECKELEAKCKQEWIYKDGFWGCLLTSKINQKSIFLPATRKFKDGQWLGYYWTRNLHSKRFFYHCSEGMTIDRKGLHTYHFTGFFRRGGNPVRAVYKR